MRRGFTLIELLAVIVILAIIALIATPIIIGLIDDARKESFKDSAYGIIKSGEILYSQSLLNETTEEVTFTYTDGAESSSVVGKQLNYNGTKPQNGQIKVNIIGQIAIAIHNGSYCAEKGYDDTEVTLSNKTSAECIIVGPIIYTDYIVAEGVNKPKLATGMTPVKWNGSAWVNTTEADTDWYNYTTTDKKWANAQTADGSFWVWIPRYIYKISSGWHTNTVGTIDIQFSRDTDDTIDGTVTIVNTGNATDSNNTWTNHPAFKFGTDELTGIWVGKFEPSGSEFTKSIIPGANSQSNYELGSYFGAARSMETDNRFGWGNTGSGIDTHMAKNIEWGAIAYLSHSQYGKNAVITMNNGSFGNYTGGGTGNAYVTNVNQSSTGNIYGIYDLNGNQTEYTAAYIDNGHSNLNFGSYNVMAAAAKYKDKYVVGTSDTGALNYAANMKKGDAIYETSSTQGGNNAWNTSTASMVNTMFPWFQRGGHANSAPNTGLFHFTSMTGLGSDSGYSTFRPILLVGSGL